MSDFQFIFAIIVFLLYFVILNVLLLVTDLFSLKIVKNTIGKNHKTQFYKKHFHKVFWFTVLSYVISITVLAFIFTFLKDEYDLIEFLFNVLLVIFRVVTEPSIYPDQTIPFLIIAVLSAFLASIIFNYFIVFRKLDVTKPKRLCTALIVSAMTAPYFFFVPFGGILEQIV